MDSWTITLAALAIFAAITVISAERCPTPDVPERRRTELISDNELKDDYKKGSVVVWECKKGKGFGHVYVECKGNGEWTKPSRKCKDSFEFNWGTGAGILCAAFTIIIEIVFVVMASKQMKKKKADEDVELRIMQNGNAGGEEKK